MKPNDENAKLPLAERPFRIMIISGSQRRQYNCPGVDSKSRMLMLKMAEMLPEEWEVDYEDLANVYKREKIQPCNACVSTSMALCVWPCNCYSKNDSAEPDLMWNLDMYARLDMADAWAIIGPVNWYGPTSNLKAMFDRLVCMNGGNPDEETIAHKDPEKAMAFEKTDAFQAMSINHLEGRTAGFFCYADKGGDEMGADGRPAILRHKNYFDPQREPFIDERDAYAPLVWQCRYGGIEVPDDLWTVAITGEGEKYSDNQAEHVVKDPEFMGAFENWVKRFTHFVAEKGKVPAGKYRAFGFTPPFSPLQELKTGIRSWKLRFGLSPGGSSPEQQAALNLNNDTTLHPGKSEGEKLRNK